jgi:hypothetical protein
MMDDMMTRYDGWYGWGYTGRESVYERQRPERSNKSPPSIVPGRASLLLAPLLRKVE